MSTCLIIAGSDSLTQGLARILERSYALTARGVRPWRRGAAGGDKLGLVVDRFHHIADELEAALAGGHGRCLAFFELCDSAGGAVRPINPIDNVTEDPSGSSLAGMCVLAFPEVHWVFLSPYDARALLAIDAEDGLDERFLRAAHFVDTSTFGEFERGVRCVVDLYIQGFEVLYDPTGLRRRVLTSVTETLENKRQVASYVPVRSAVAAALDDEEAFALFVGYAGYKFGHRTYLLSSYRAMKRLFEVNDAGKVLDIVFEDIYLNFADRPPNVHLSCLAARATEFPSLKGANRICLTTGEFKCAEHGADCWENVFTTKLTKPFGGLFGLREVSLPDAGRGDVGLRGAFNLSRAPTFDPRPADTGTQAGGHSAPGRLLVVAERLVQRAERLANEVITVRDAVYGAMLASDAQDLLWSRTPTTALRALAVKHELEVRAECLFHGVQPTADVAARLAEISAEVKAITARFEQHSRARSELSAENRIISRLTGLFHEFNQFDAENECLEAARNSERRRLAGAIAGSTHRVRATVRWAFATYVYGCLDSMWRFTAYIMLWIAAFGVLYWVADHAGATKSWWRWLFYSAITFVSLGVPEGGVVGGLTSIPPATLVLIFMEVVVGFVHLGILVSHVYFLLSRR